MIRLAPQQKNSVPGLSRVTTAAMMTAIIFLFTFLIKLPTAVGYIHLGDALLLLYAAATADPIALLAGALGEGLADLAGGYAPYIPATVLIKAAIALPVVFAAKRERREHPEPICRTRRIVLSTLPSVPITLGGYFAVDYFLTRAYAFAALGTNAIQAVASILLFLLLATAFDKSSFKRYL